MQYMYMGVCVCVSAFDLFDLSVLVIGMQCKDKKRESPSPLDGSSEMPLLYSLCISCFVLLVKLFQLVAC